MTHEAALRAYCRSVGDALRLQKRRKREILTGLRQELEERFPGSEALTLEKISAEIGPYDMVANELMEGVPAEEREQYLIWQKWLGRCVVIVLALLLTASVVFFIYTEKTQVVRSEVQVTYLPDDYVFNSTADKND